MIGSPREQTGFVQRVAMSTSQRLTHAVAAALALGSLSLCLILTLTVLSTRISMAMPFQG